MYTANEHSAEREMLASACLYARYWLVIIFGPTITEPQVWKLS